MTNPAETLRQKASRLLNEYNALHDESAYAEAKRAYQQLLAEDPDCAGLHLEYGMLQDWYGRRSIRAAVACYERAIELDPGQDAPHFQLTHSRAALAIWQTFKQRGDPENLEPYYMSAFALEAMGRYQEAIAEWRYIIDWHEAHDHAIHTEWPKEMIAGIEAKIAAADPSADGTRS